MLKNITVSSYSATVLWYGESGALDGEGGAVQMSIIRNVNVSLSNLRNAHVILSILRNDHVPCHFLFKSHVACH